MKKIISMFLSAIVSIAFMAGCSGTSAQIKNSSKTSENKLSVCASFYTMYDFAKKIGGEKAEVMNMVPIGTEPHNWEPAASDITALEKADVFIYNGAGMEHWVSSVLDSIQNKDLISVETSKGLTLLKGNAHGEHQMEYDPHVWLSPLNGKKQMQNIKEAFVKADPNNQEYYEQNYQKYAAEFDTLDKEYRDTLLPLKNKDIIVTHQAFGYLCDAYGLNQIAIEGLSADFEPNPAKMSEIIQFAKEHQVKTIFFETLVNSKVAETIANATGAKTEVLNPLGGLSDEEKAAGDDYFSVMRRNLKALKNALQ